MAQSEQATNLPSVWAWENKTPDAATPKCPECGRGLGIRRAMFSASGRDVWLCDTHGELS